MGQDTNEVFLCVFALACMRFHLGAVYVFAYSVCRTPIPAHGRGRGLVKCSAGVAVPKQKTVREPVKVVHSKRPHQVPVARIHRLGEGIQGRHMRLERLKGAVGVDGFRGDRVRASVGRQRGAQPKPKEKESERERGRG